LAAPRQFEGGTSETHTESEVRVEVWREDTTTMDAQRQKSGGGRRRRRKARAEPRTNAEPVLIAARRPNSPKLGDNGRKLVAASAAPARPAAPKQSQNEAAKPKRHPAEGHKRSARIIQVAQTERDEREKLRLRLPEKLLLSEGRGAISRAAEAYLENEFEFPEEQEVQLQLLEHFNEARAQEAVGAMARLLQKEPPIKRPILDQRLRRLEEYADEPATREQAAALRRALRT
jgi:hypothetical protein